MKKIFVAIGGNSREARPGSRNETIRRTIAKFDRVGIRPLRISAVYDTAPLGPGRQLRYTNLVVLAETSLAPAAVLRELKRLERAAGRRIGPVVWGPRTIDLDLLDYDRHRYGWRRRPIRRRERGRLILPHPEAHRRAFVLIPLLDLAPMFWHSALRRPARTLLLRLGRKRGDVVLLAGSGDTLFP